MEAVELHPWDRQPHEGSKAYAAFLAYRDSGSERALRAIAKQLGKSNTLVMRWCREKDWVKRVEAWDNHNALLRVQEVQKAMAQEAKLWADRQNSVRARQWEMAERLLARAEKMLAWPLSTQRTREELVEDGPDKKVVKVTEVHPAKWQQHTAAIIVNLANRLMREATGLPTNEPLEISGPAGGPIELDITVKKEIDYDGLKQVAAEYFAVSAQDNNGEPLHPPSTDAKAIDISSHTGP